MDGASAPIFLVAGGHEQGAMYLLDGPPNNAAVWVGRARNKFYPLPEPNAFYTGDQDKGGWSLLARCEITTPARRGATPSSSRWIPIGISKQPVDTMLVEEGKGSLATAARAATGRSVSTDMWEVTHGEAQSRWLKKTLEESKAKYKFVFAHHVLGTSRVRR